MPDDLAPAPQTAPDFDATARHAELRTANAREFVQTFRSLHADAPEAEVQLADALKTNGYSGEEITALTADSGLIAPPIPI